MKKANHKPVTKITQLFINSAVSAGTVLACLFVAALFSCVAENKSPFQDWVYNCLPLFGIFFTITASITILLGIATMIEKLLK